MARHPGWQAAQFRMFRPECFVGLVNPNKSWEMLGGKVPAFMEIANQPNASKCLVHFGKVLDVDEGHAAGNYLGLTAP